jgi:cytochrome oxidase assembly protein ShyY1
MSPPYVVPPPSYVGFVFLLSRRWVLFFVFVTALGVACVLLGRWQFHRLSERRDNNDVIRTNLHATPAPVEMVLTDRSPDHNLQWRVVTATGTYDPASTLLVKYITHKGNPGVDVVVPLRLANRSAVLVDRGWIAGPDNGQRMPTAPAPPTGRVTVTGWVRLDSTHQSASTPHDRTIRQIGTKQLGSSFPYPILGGYVSAHQEAPKAAHTPIRNDGPDLSDGPHFFYGLQWFFFGLLAVSGFVWFAWIEYQERKHPHSERMAPPSTGSITPVR